MQFERVVEHLAEGDRRGLVVGRLVVQVDKVDSRDGLLKRLKALIERVAGARAVRGHQVLDVVEIPHFPASNAET